MTQAAMACSSRPTPCPGRTLPTRVVARILAKGRHAAGNGEGDDLDPAGVDADGGGSRLVAAGGEDVIAEAVAMHEDIECDRQGNKPPEGSVDAEKGAAK